MSIPAEFLEEGTKLAEGMKIFDVPLAELTREELVACVAKFADRCRIRDAHDRQRAMDLLASIPSIA